MDHGRYSSLAIIGAFQADRLLKNIVFTEEANARALVNLNSVCDNNEYMSQYRSAVILRNFKNDIVNFAIRPRFVLGGNPPIRFRLFFPAARNEIAP